MKNVKKRKNGFKKFIRTVVFTMVLCAGGVGALLYNRLFFKGEVKDKYQSDEQPKGNRIRAKTWFGEKDFCVNDETYANVKLGERYSFKKETSVDWVKLQDKQDEVKTQVVEVTDKKQSSEEFKFI